MNEKMFIDLFEYFEGRQNDEIMREIEDIRQKIITIEGKLNHTINGVNYLLEKLYQKEEQKEFKEISNNEYNDFGKDFDF